MKLSKLRIGALAVLFAIFFAALGAGAVFAAGGGGGHMVSARDDLNSALSQLQQANEDKGGHRANAIKYTQQAISEVTAGIQYAK